ncbi:adhesion G-protein coupled receptor G4 [Aplochiton taeniatus]
MQSRCRWCLFVLLEAPRVSLWGKVANFTGWCSHWRLNPNVSIPALKELTVCLHLQLRNRPGPLWVAFMYHPPGIHWDELGLGGRDGYLLAWLFGMEWRSAAPANLQLKQWHYLCLTWSESTHQPALYVDGRSVAMVSGKAEAPHRDPRLPCCSLAPGGTLSLGASHHVASGVMHVGRDTWMPGQVSLFRLWGRARSSQEVLSLNCTEGDVVRWDLEDWNCLEACVAVTDLSLQCEWSLYEVRLVFMIFGPEGNTNNSYKVRDIAHQWLRDVLPDTLYLHRVSVSLSSSTSITRPWRSTVSPTTSAPTSTPSTLKPTTPSARTPDAPATTPGNLTEMFFEVNANVTLKEACLNTAACILSWLNKTLDSNEMTVINFVLLTKGYRERCVFQVQVRTSSDDDETETWLRKLLEKPSASVATSAEDIDIQHIWPGECPVHKHQTREGLFEWPATSALKKVTLPCEGNPDRQASRQCKLGISTLFQTQWEAPNLNRCSLVVEKIPDLKTIKVTAENALDVVVMVESLLRDHPTLDYSELLTVLNKLKDIVCMSPVTPALGQAVVTVLSDILNSNSNLQPFTNTILNLTESVGDKMSSFNGSQSLVAPAIAISVVDVDPTDFSRLTFGVSSVDTALLPEIFINKKPFRGTVAFISLPSVLKHSFPQQTQPRIQFQYYGIPMLFKDNLEGLTLNTYVVSASVRNATSPITDLSEDIKVTLRHLIPNTLAKKVKCVFWNFNLNGGQGGWDSSGCRKHNTSVHCTTCLCDHLTHFGVLLDVSRTQLDGANEQILTLITYLGCGVSSLFLGVTILTYTAFEKLRRDYPSKILINLSLALLGLDLAFLVDSWLSSWGLYGLCVAAAFALHYFLLASFTWMGLEAVNMYFALVKVFNVYVPSYILKFCLLGWGIPLVVCGLVVVVNRDAYGSQLYNNGQPSLEPLDNSDDFCWLQDDVAFFISVVGYAVLVFLFNMAVFVVVLVQIRHMRANQPAGIRSGLLHDLKGVASLTFLLGLTWVTGFFTWGPARVPLLYLFATLNSLQGLFVFLFHCLMKENVRKQWRVHLCLGRYRLQEYSEGSQTGTVGARHRPNPPVPVPSIRSVKSSATDSTSASSQSSQRLATITRPNLELFYMNALAVPRAQQRTPAPLLHKSPLFPEERDPYTPTWTDRPTPRIMHS